MLLSVHVHMDVDTVVEDDARVWQMSLKISLPISYHVKFSTSAAKGVYINKRNHKIVERFAPPPLW